LMRTAEILCLENFPLIPLISAGDFQWSAFFLSTSPPLLF
jgi:hypothetical protein